MNFILAIRILLLSLIIGVNACAQHQKDTLNILFVGNSYTYYENMPQIVSLISDNLDIKLITRKSTVGGARLRDHWLGKKGLKTKEIIKAGNFDAIVLQEYSLGAVKEPDSLFKYTNLWCDFIKKHNAKPVLYLTWAREKSPEQQEIINGVFTEVSKRNDVEIVPVGFAWEMAKKMNPAMALYKADGSHPDRLGAFLTACTFTRFFSKMLPEKMGLRYYTEDLFGESIQLMLINESDAQFCKDISEKSIKNH